MQIRCIQLGEIKHLSKETKTAYIEKLGELAKHGKVASASSVYTVAANGWYEA